MTQTTTPTKSSKPRKASPYSGSAEAYSNRGVRMTVKLKGLYTMPVGSSANVGQTFGTPTASGLTP